MLWIDAWKISNGGDGTLKLFSDLAEAVGQGKTWAGLAKRVGEVLGAEWPLGWLAVGWLGEGEGFWGDMPDGFWGEVGEGIERAVESGEAQRGWRDGEGVVVAPLEAGVGRGGYVVFGQAQMTEQGFLGVVVRLLGVGVEQVRLLERVAAVSRRAHQESRVLRKRLQEFGRGGLQSEAMRVLVERMGLVASYETTVLLRGESGTGKEVLAREIHRLSSRSGGPMVKVNCGALPEGLVESELFGHERGAFTGAQGRHIGRFERAQGGTLLLDEVGELPLSAQVKLLRVLQEGEIERVGGEEVIKVDVRVIAATHQRLEEMVAQGRFRADLFYRLNVFPLEVPPLRERREDIPGLVGELLAKIGGRVGRREGLRVGRGVMGRLQGYGWPGNVRELENVLERAVILTRGEWLELPVEFGESGMDGGVGLGGGEEGGERLDATVKRALEGALRRSGGRIYGEGGAAASLGLKPSTLQSKMKKLGIVKRRR